jgi:molecular chaperone HtpG
MKDGQDHIYYLTGESRQAIENSPHMEAFQARGIEVLLLTDPVDEVWVDTAPAFDGKQFRSVAKGVVDLGTQEEKQEADTEREKQQEEYAGVLTWMTQRLSDHVKEVRLSSRLTVSPACVVSDTHDATPALESIYRAMGQEIPGSKRILELNPKHPLVVSLNRAHANRRDDALGETAELIHNLALLAEGSEPIDPARFVKLMADRIERTL